MTVFCLEEPVFYFLIEKVVERIEEKQNITQDKRISGEEAMQKFCIASKITLQKLRDEGKNHFFHNRKGR